VEEFGFPLSGEQAGKTMPVKIGSRGKSVRLPLFRSFRRHSMRSWGEKEGRDLLLEILPECLFLLHQ